MVAIARKSEADVLSKFQYDTSIPREYYAYLNSTAPNSTNMALWICSFVTGGFLLIQYLAMSFICPYLRHSAYRAYDLVYRVLVSYSNFFVLVRKHSCTDKLEMLPAPMSEASDDSSINCEPEAKRTKLDNQTIDGYV